MVWIDVIHWLPDKNQSSSRRVWLSDGLTTRILFYGL
jgi:hypothetical protein